MTIVSEVTRLPADSMTNFGPNASVDVPKSDKKVISVHAGSLWGANQSSTTRTITDVNVNGASA